VLRRAPDTSQTQPEAANRGPPRVSVVIPVYNAGALLRPCLDSVLAQDLAPGAFEVIAVDDGSTDGSGAVLDDYAATHPNIHVIHQANAGWPGRPRNVGTDIARGDYVFYLDADDMVGPQALRRMVEFADQHRSDVVVAPTQWLKDERPLRDPPMETRVDAPLDRVFRSLGAAPKLLRRSFIQAAELRFPEGRVPLEDGIVMARAYLLASRVSTLGGSKAYYRRADVEGGNISRSRTHPDDYARSIATIMDTVRELDHDQDRADRIVLGLYRRKALKFFSPGRFDRYGPRQQHRCVTAIQRLASSHVSPALESQLPEPHRTRSRAVRSGDVNALVRLAGSTPWRSRRRWLHARLRARVRRALLRIRGIRTP
jgi:poly(ribitol-phosphate) beta-N-acetylglucosaminyltransferase